MASKRVYRTTGGANVSMLSYTYDNDDNITAITDGVDATRTTNYAYDSVGRLTRFDGNLAGGIKREDQLHDKNGNRTRVERRLLASDATPASVDSYATTAGTNRLASISAAAGTRSLSYDARGNLATETRPGAVTASTAYDGYARLTGYTRSGEAALSFGYNGLDDRVTQVSGTTTTRYVYDADGRVIGEYGVSATDVKAEYIWLSPEVANDNVWGGTDGVGGHAPLAVSSAPAGGTALLSWVHANHIGAPLLTTNASGTAITPTGYTQIAFPGQMRTLPDLYYNRYRDYDPTTGRYVQADPIGLDGDANPYSYAMNNPLRYVDPTGEFVPLLIGIGLGIGIEYLTNPCATLGDLALAGSIGGLGGLGGANLAVSYAKGLSVIQKGKIGEAVARLGIAARGGNVLRKGKGAITSFPSLRGAAARSKPDFVVKTFGGRVKVVEAKFGNAPLSNGQRALNDILGPEVFRTARFGYDDIGRIGAAAGGSTAVGVGR